MASLYEEGEMLDEEIVGEEATLVVEQLAVGRQAVAGERVARNATPLSLRHECLVDVAKLTTTPV